MRSVDTGPIITWNRCRETHGLKQLGHTLFAEAVALATDGRVIASTSKDHRNKLWGAHNWLFVAMVTAHSVSVSAVRLSTNERILSSTYDGTICAHDIERNCNFHMMTTLPPLWQYDFVTTDGSGDVLGTGCVDALEAIVCSLRTGPVSEVFNGHKIPVHDVDFWRLRGTFGFAAWDMYVLLCHIYAWKAVVICWTIVKTSLAWHFFLRDGHWVLLRHVARSSYVMQTWVTSSVRLMGHVVRPQYNR